MDHAESTDRQPPEPTFRRNTGRPASVRTLAWTRATYPAKGLVDDHSLAQNREYRNALTSGRIQRSPVDANRFHAGLNPPPQTAELTSVGTSIRLQAGSLGIIDKLGI